MCFLSDEFSTFIILTKKRTGNSCREIRVSRRIGEMRLEQGHEDEELFILLQFKEFPELAESFEDEMLMNQYHLRENKRFKNSPVCILANFFRSQNFENLLKFRLLADHWIFRYACSFILALKLRMIRSINVFCWHKLTSWQKNRVQDLLSFAVALFYFGVMHSLGSYYGTINSEMDSALPWPVNGNISEVKRYFPK